MVETKRELRVKRGISAESPKKAAIPFTDCGLYLWCRRPDSNSDRRGLLPPQAQLATSRKILKLHNYLKCWLKMLI